MRALINMNAGHDRCMYCEYSEAGTVDHFCPRARDPNQTFHWRNLILACGRCQAAKGDRFNKELLNPARHGYTPSDHFELESDTGEFVLLSAESKSTNQIIRWERDILVRSRRATLQSYQAAIIAYAEAINVRNTASSQKAVQWARDLPHPTVFDWIIHWCLQGPPAQGPDPLDPRVRSAVAAHPGIRTWL
ncbi:MAG: HNH endonuclease [Deltaproteobacteria bacterium]|nr:HNH endonuclease [Deltaproteobacteria bacterium]